MKRAIVHVDRAIADEAMRLIPAAGLRVIKQRAVRRRQHVLEWLIEGDRLPPECDRRHDRRVSLIFETTGPGEAALREIRLEA